MSSLWGARKNFAFHVHHLNHGTTQSGAGEEKHSCFSAEVPQDVFIMKPPPHPPMTSSLQPLILERNLLSCFTNRLQQMSKLSETHCSGVQNSRKSLQNLEMMTR